MEHLLNIQRGTFVKNHFTERRSSMFPILNEKNLILNVKQKIITSLPGLEPGIFRFEVERVIHYATGPKAN
jgi:hypothetical protein